MDIEDKRKELIAYYESLSPIEKTAFDLEFTDELLDEFEKGSTPIRI